MITGNGDYIFGSLTDSGDFVFNGITENGDFVFNEADTGLSVIFTSTGGAVSGGSAGVLWLQNVTQLTVVPETRQNSVDPRIDLKTSWEAVLPPVASTPDALPPIYGLTDYAIILGESDITNLVESVTINESESSIFSDCTFDLPVGVVVGQRDTVTITIAGLDRYYMVEEVSAAGPTRSVWCRSAAAVLDEPNAAEITCNGWDTPCSTAYDLAVFICGGVPLVWSLSNWTLPPSWELSGTPVECLQTLAQACGGIVQSTPDGGVEVRKRWPIRPVDMSATTPNLSINRDSALEISAKEQPGKGYGAITVYGYDPSANLPTLEAEEISPKPGQPVHVRIYWRTASRPPFNHFVSDGSAYKVGSGISVVQDEEVLFDQGSGSTRFPVSALHSFVWLGSDQGNIWWLSGGDSHELGMDNPDGRGIALVTYSAGYDRWALNGQTANKVIFGIDVGEGQVSATVKYASGGTMAPSVTAPLLNDTNICIDTGTAYLDESRARQIVNADMPLTGAPSVPGTAVDIYDPVTGIDGMAKVVSCTTKLTATRTTLSVEAQICH